MNERHAMARIIHIPGRKPTKIKKPSGSKGKVLRFLVPYLPPRECLGSPKLDSIAPYGSPENSKKTPSRESSSKDLGELLKKLSPEQIEAGLKEVGQMQKEGLLQVPED